MSKAPSSRVMATDDEKNPGVYETEPNADVVATPIVEKDVVASEGDDALRLAGTHAHHFDEQYYLRLRRKIVSGLT